MKTEPKDNINLHVTSDPPNEEEKCDVDDEEDDIYILNETSQ